MLHLPVGTAADGDAADLRVGAGALPLLVRQPLQLVSEAAPEGAQGGTDAAGVVFDVLPFPRQLLLVPGL